MPRLARDRHLGGWVMFRLAVALVIGIAAAVYGVFVWVTK